MKRENLFLIMLAIFALLAEASILFAHDYPKTIAFACLMLWCIYMIDRTKETIKQRVIVCAANKLASGLIVCGARHHDTFMNAQIKAARDTHVGEEQGFIDNKGNFLTREEAHKIAYWNGQRKYRCGGDNKTLFSENLY